MDDRQPPTTVLFRKEQSTRSRPPVGQGHTPGGGQFYHGKVDQFQDGINIIAALLYGGAWGRAEPALEHVTEQPQQAAVGGGQPVPERARLGYGGRGGTRVGNRDMMRLLLARRCGWSAAS